MTQLSLKTVPVSREEFLTPFDSFFDNVIEKAFPEFGQEFGVSFFGNNSYPKVDVLDHPDSIEIEAEIPGLSKDNVSVDLEEDVLSIVGKRQDSDKKEGSKYIKRELKRSSFKRSFKLNGNLDLKRIKAEFKDGLLNIKVNKLVPEKPKKIKIL